MNSFFCLARSLWVHLVFHDILRSQNFFTNSLYIHYLFRELTIIPLSLFWLNSMKVSKVVNSEQVFYQNRSNDNCSTTSEDFKVPNWILDQILSQNICILYTIGPNSPIWLFLDKFHFLWPDLTWFNAQQNQSCKMNCKNCDNFEIAIS